MNLLDENIRQDQRGLLQAWGISVHQRDLGFYDHRLCHPRYCLVCLSIGKEEVASFVRRFLRHPEVDTKTKRLGVVIRVTHQGFSIWRRNMEKETHINW